MEEHLPEVLLQVEAASGGAEVEKWLVEVSAATYEESQSSEQMKDKFVAKSLPCCCISSEIKTWVLVSSSEELLL